VRTLYNQTKVTDVSCEECSNLFLGRKKLTCAPYWTLYFIRAIISGRT